MRVGPATAAQTAALRRAVLRPGAVGPLPGDEDPTAAFVAAWEGDEVVGTANVRPATTSYDEGVWRLRGMATAERLRGTGVGATVLAAATAHVSAQSGRLLWCNARTPARRFYERAGFVVVGEEWDDPDLGPHVRMELRLPVGR